MALLRKNREATDEATPAQGREATKTPDAGRQPDEPRGDRTTQAQPTRSTASTTSTTSAAPTAPTPTGTRETRTVDRRQAAYERFGGINWGAAFFGWLVAVGVAAILTGIVSAVLAGIGSTQEITRADAEADVGTYGTVAAVIVLVILSVAYYTGGYVSGRMSRFDGGKQGLGAWLIGVLMTLIAVAIGAVAGSEYNVLDRVNMPSLPVSSDELGIVGVVAGLAILLATVLSSMGGGKVGMRYHAKVDRAFRSS